MPTSRKRAAGAIIAASILLTIGIAAGSSCQGRSAITRLFGPPTVTMTEKYGAGVDGPKFDHSTLDKLLQEHVVDGGWVNYDGLAQDVPRLDQYIASLAQAPLNEMGRNERLTLLINGYNAFTLRLMLDNPSVRSIRDISAPKRWDAKRWNVGGNVWSLNQIEHEQIRPNFREPRIHFALVCAAVGCPPLRREAYVSARLEEQLQSQAQIVHSAARWFQFDQTTGAVRLTRLYDWYAGDFEQVAGSVVAYAAQFSPSLRAYLNSGGKPAVEFLDYDWSRNGVENRK